VTTGVVEGDRKNGEVANIAVSVVLGDGAHMLCKVMSRIYVYGIAESRFESGETVLCSGTSNVSTGSFGDQTAY
jgi:hypothetical protein